MSCLFLQLVCTLLMVFRCSLAFSSFHKWTSPLRTTLTTSTTRCSSTKLNVRNIDLPEAIVFYGVHSILDAKTGELLNGVDSLLNECQRDDTAALLVSYEDHSKEIQSVVQHLVEKNSLKVHVDLDHPPPNPRALWEAIESTTIQPKGFGGSSGFGTKQPEPERPPLPKHVVVLANTDDQCRAARFFGARVMSMQDNDLADGIVVDWSEISIDDISTPGSYWLNPPFGGKDDDGNKIDLFQVIENIEKGGRSSEEVCPILSEDDITAILDDLDPL